MTTEGVRTSWHVFCRVIDNFGDAGVCWRLARQLATVHRLDLTLWIDRPEVLARLVPPLATSARHDGVAVRAWTDAPAPLPPDAAVVIAAFGAELPPAVRESMRARSRPPIWINLEYLSAEDWVASHHGLPSPKPDGLIEHFFFPGFGDDTGGLLREPDLLAERDRFLADAPARVAWLASLGVQRQADERLMSLFCYPQADGAALLAALRASGTRWRVLVPDGVRASGLDAITVTVQPVPFLPQRDYDRLLWCCDANLVRGEDSVVRALWSARPFLWQAYPQQQAAHMAKVRALVARWHHDAHPSAAAAEANLQAHLAWNTQDKAVVLRSNEAGTGDVNEGQEVASTGSALRRWVDALPALGAAAGRWSASQAAPGADLASRLVRFVTDRI